MSSTNTGDEFAVGLLNGMEKVNEHADGSLKSTAEFSGFIKKLVKLEANFGKELSMLVAKDGKKLLSLPHLTGLTTFLLFLFLLTFSYMCAFTERYMISLRRSCRSWTRLRAVTISTASR